MPRQLPSGNAILGHPHQGRKPRRKAADPRPLSHPLWPAFWLWVKEGGARVNPRLVDDANQYGIHGGLLWEAFVAGAEVGAMRGHEPK